MIRKDRAAAIAYWLHTPKTTSIIPPKHEKDLSQQARWLKMKRIDYSFHKSDPDNSFGMYLGQHGDEFVVATQTLAWDLNGCEVFKSIDDLTQHWILD